MSDDLYLGHCEAGCLRFHGGEVRHHPDCGHYPQSLTKLNADRIEELQTRAEVAEDKLAEQIEWVKRLADELIASEGREGRLKAKLERAVNGLKESRVEIDAYVDELYPYCHPVQERYRERGYSSNPARVALAELEEKDDD